MFEIEDDVPLPEGSGKGRPRKGRFPFERMEVGQSFEVDLESLGSKNPYGLVKVSANRASVTGKRFIIRTVAEGKVRVWREA